MEELRIRFGDEGVKQARIKVIGVGGAGGNALNGMIEANLAGVEFIAINTDEQALEMSRASVCLPIGHTGLGAGADPEVGRQAMEEDREKLFDLLIDTDLVFITAGLGGGTGTGASPIVAQVAHEMGVLTVAVVTKPFFFEGRQRMVRAEDGITRLKDHVDTLILIPNQRLVAIIERGTPLKEAFRKADEVLLQATRGISDLVMVPGLINLDFADVKTVMSAGGDALMGVGVAQGENRALEAAQQAIASPFMEDVCIQGARAVLANITGNLSFDDYNEASNVVHEAVGDDANIFVGAVVDPNMNDEVRVTVIATGFNHIRERKQVVPEKEAKPAGDYPRQVAYRPLRKITERPAILTPGSTESGPVQPTASAKKLPLERPTAGIINLDDRNIPAFLRKQMD
ncbi:cell division protein FtsZ [candidate division LCP-89 bacterium B3_LCP]|uniref:Cell division protein FtsZ n=1 Tax=candidate division LCP-89 bacterium B3_LCP TaxID=2012998 RepID=A0A532V2P4_UNCL8|nr:MAG: cell division protein FtsZ [candidate division LCP-89 bacterium B3_LCP]